MSGRSPNNIAQAMAEFMGRYQYVRERSKISKENPIYQRFSELRALIESAPPVMNAPSLLVKSSLGQGRWAAVPWLAIRSGSPTNRMRVSDGPCVAFLFRADMTGVCLGLSQGTAGSWERAAMRDRTAKLRVQFAGLAKRGFSVDDNLSLASDGLLPKRYEEATVAYKMYDKASLPTDHEIAADLTVLLAAYEAIE